MTSYGRRDRALTGPVWTREYNSFRLADHTDYCRLREITSRPVIGLIHTRGTRDQVYENTAMRRADSGGTARARVACDVDHRVDQKKSCSHSRTR